MYKQWIIWKQNTTCSVLGNKKYFILRFVYKGDIIIIVLIYYNEKRGKVKKMKVVKRDNSVVDFDATKIESAILQADRKSVV